MGRLRGVATLAALLLTPGIAVAGEEPRRVRLAPIDLAAGAPADATAPEGTTRWNLESVALGEAHVRLLEPTDGEVSVTDGAGRIVFADPTGGDAAVRWLLPDRAPISMIPGTGEVLLVARRDATGEEMLRIDARIVGIGWVHLPSGPREVVLQRATITGDDGATTLHRWIDPRAGVVAQVSLTGGEVVDEVLAGAATLKIFPDEIIHPTFTTIGLGWDRGPGTEVSSLTPDAHATIGDLIAASSWDFSGNGELHPIAGTTTASATTSIVGVGTSFTTDLEVGDLISLSSAPQTFAEVTAITSDTQLTVDIPLGDGETQTVNLKSAQIAETNVPINSNETCNFAQCGYPEGDFLSRTDKDFDVPGRLQKINASLDREDTASGTTVWLRGGARKEGVAGDFGEGESRFCHVGGGRTPVPLWEFANTDDGGASWYLQAGDSWQGGPFNCEQIIFNQLCGAPQFSDEIWAQPCGDHSGTQFTDVIKNGVVTLPSGHTFNALLVRNVADFCVYIPFFGNCGIKVDEVRTVNYLWSVPHLGTVARVQSEQDAPDLTSFSVLDETNLNFGLFPPRTITVTGNTDTTVDLSWDPGLDDRHVLNYKIYWDTDSGGSTPYGSNSDDNSGQVTFTGSGTTATITGLSSSTTYFFTVTTRSSYTDPSTGNPQTYESLLFPTQVSGDPSFVYPVEVQVTTDGGACTPTTEVTTLTVNKSGTDVEFCWTTVVDPCLTGYRVLGADTPEAAENFSTVADVGTTCWTGDPSETFFLSVAVGSGGEGPWGHYGK